MIRPLFEYPVEEWLNQLQAYNNHPGVDRLLELPRKIWRAGDYLYHSYATPGGDRTQLAFTQRQTREFAITVTSGAYFTSIGQWHSENAGFIFQITDKGAKTVYCDNDMIRASIGAGRMEADTIHPPNLWTGQPQPIGLHLFDSPLIVLEPGQLVVEMTNLHTSNQNCQLFMTFAVPANLKSINNPVMRSV